MTRVEGSNRWARRLFAAAAGLAFLCAALTQAQGRQRTYGPGEMVEVDGGEVYQIIRCEGGEWDDCEVQAYQNNRPTGNRFKISLRNIRAAEQRLLDARARAAGPGPNTAGPPNGGAGRNTQAGAVAGLDGKWKVGDELEVNDRAFWYKARIVEAKGGRYKVHFEGYPDSDDKWVDASRMRPVGGHRVEAECGYEPPGPAVSARTPFSEALARRKVFDEYSRKANGTLSAPKKVGVTFLSFRLTGTQKNTVANVPGYGAQRRHGGAPVGAALHTFRSRHMVCEWWPDGVKRRIVEGSFACFVDRDGSWTCPSENDTKITQLDQD